MTTRATFSYNKTCPKRPSSNKIGIVQTHLPIQQTESDLYIFVVLRRVERPMLKPKNIALDIEGKNVGDVFSVDLHFGDEVLI